MTTGHAASLGREPPQARGAVAVRRAGRGWPRRATLAAIVALALVLRLWHIRQGLPDFLEEAIPFRRALAMWGWASGHPDWNPHFFQYPSLSLYLHHLLQRAHVAWGLAAGRFARPEDYYLMYRTDPSPMVVLARLLGVTADTATVVGVAVIGERLRRGAGLLAAAMVATAAVMILHARTIHADTLMTTLAVWGVERLLAYRRQGGTGRLAAALVLIGLAIGTKYPALLLVIPLASVLVERHRARVAPVGAAAMATVAAVALLTTPYALIELPTFRRDLAFVGQLPGSGHLGNLERPAFLYDLGQIGHDLGWVAVALLVVSFLDLMGRGRERGERVALWLVLLAFAVPISLGRILAQRYLTPVIPFAAILAAAAALAVADRLPPGWARAVRPVLLLGLLIPPLLGGVQAGASGTEDSQAEARRWCQAHLDPRAILLQEAYGVALPTRVALERVLAEPAARRASAPVRERFAGRRTYAVVTLPLSVAGRCVSRVPVPGQPLVELPVFPHPADFNGVFYDPRVLVGADFVLTSSAVRGRFEADPRRFATQGRFYRLLDAEATVAARFPSRPGVVGPTITIYRLGPRTDSLIVARLGVLDRHWWAATIPDDYRERAEALLRPPGWPRVTSPTDADGRTAMWVMSLREVFEEQVHRFGSQMAGELADAGRWDPAARFAAADLEMSPGDLDDCLALTTSAGHLGDWGWARSAVERAIAATSPGDRALPALRLEHARILLEQRAPALARDELMRVAGDPAADPAVAALARAGLERLAGPRPSGARAH